jgi:CheY-like chemotaxis protein
MTAVVVVADDDAGIRDLVETALGCEGYCVVPAVDGREALNHVETQAPTLALTDLQMPVMNGWDLLACVRQSGVAVPVVLMSAGCDVSAEAARHQADGFLPKPFELDALLRTVERFVPNPCP